MGELLVTGSGGDKFPRNYQFFPNARYDAFIGPTGLLGINVFAGQTLVASRPFTALIYYI